MTRVTITILGAVLVTMAAVQASQSGAPFTRLTKEQCLAIALEVNKAQVLDAGGFISHVIYSLKQSGRADHEIRPIGILATPDLSVTLYGPAYGYFLDLYEANRKMNPIESVPWVGVHGIRVSPTTINAPLIEKIVVQRDDVVVPSTGGSFGPTTLTTRMGAKVTVNAGVLLFPANTFDPGGSVRITVIPTTGSNVVKTLTDADLRRAQ